jgi:tetratricopeptide (TPR) repeat protein
MSRTAWACAALMICVQCACSRSAQSYLSRGNVLFDKSEYADAELQYRNSISRDPRLAEAYYRLGLTELQLGHGDAQGDLQRSVDLDPNNEVYRVQLANVSLLAYDLDPSDQRSYNLAAQEAERLLKRSPNSFDGLRLRGDVLMIDRKSEEALALFQRADAIEPLDPNVILPMTRVMFKLGRSDEAEKVAYRFLQRRPSFAPMYDLMLAHYSSANRAADAERLMKMEVANRPKDAKAWLQLAAFYGDTHREQEMSQTLQKLSSDRANFPQGPGLAGDLYAGGGRWEDALREYREGLRSDSKYKELYETKIANALIATGKRTEAVAKLTELLKAFPNNSNARLRRAVLFTGGSDSKELDLAIADLKALAAANPQDVIAHYNLGIAYRAKGDIANAQSELKKSVGLREKYLPALFALAEIALDGRDYAGAIRLSGEILAADPDNLNARILRAAALGGNQSYDQARRELNTLSREHPGSEEIELRLAALNVAEKKYPDAEALYRRFYQSGSSDLRPFEGLLELYLIQHQPQRAQALLDDEIKRSPNSRPVHFLLASAAIKEGKLDVAREQYEWIRAVDPNSLEVYESLGALYQLQGRTKEAIESYKKASQLAPNDARILGSIAILQTNVGATKDAIATLEKQLARDPGNPSAMNNLAYNLAENGSDLDRALNLAENAVRKVPDNPAFMDTLGWVYAKRGLDQSAIQVFRVLVKKYPNEQAYRSHLDSVLAHGKSAGGAKREVSYNSPGTSAR